MEVFAFSDYRAFLSSQIEQNISTRGYQSRLSTAAGCKRSFLSQVLHSHINLTPDHGVGLCKFWNFSEDETDWFMELLSLARAGTPEMRKLCQRRLEAIKQKRTNLTERFKPKRVLPKEIQTQYYSSWHWTAVHILVCIPTFNTVPKIATRLRLNEGLVREILSSLERMGLVQIKSGTWKAIETDVHIPKASSLNLMNHSNWRQLAISRIQMGDEDSLHYTAVHSLSLKDFQKITDLLTAAIQKTRDIVRPSADEELVCLTCDFFKV